MVKFIVILSSAILLSVSTAYSVALAEQTPPKSQVVSHPDTSPVILGGRVLFSVRGFKNLKSERRAEEISTRVKKLAEDLTVRTDSITTQDSDISTDIISGDRIIMVVLDKDALPEGITRQKLAGQDVESIRSAIEKYRVDYSKRSILFGALYTFLATIVFITFLVLLFKLFRRLKDLMETRYKAKIHSINIKSVEIVHARRVTALLHGTMNLVRLLILLIIIYIYLHLVLSFFPWTRPFANQLLGYVLVPLKIIGRALIGNIPNLIFIAVLAIITRYVLKFMRIFFKQVGQGS